MSVCWRLLPITRWKWSQWGCSAKKLLWSLWSLADWHGRQGFALKTPSDQQRLTIYSLSFNEKVWNKLETENLHLKIFKAMPQQKMQLLLWRWAFTVSGLRHTFANICSLSCTAWLSQQSTPDQSDCGEDFVPACYSFLRPISCWQLPAATQQLHHRQVVSRTAWLGL